jgi:hypothetical protein
MMKACLDCNVVMWPAATVKNFLFAAAGAVLITYLASSSAGMIPDALVDMGFA